MPKYGWERRRKRRKDTGERGHMQVGEEQRSKETIERYERRRQGTMDKIRQMERAVISQVNKFKRHK